MAGAEDKYISRLYRIKKINFRVGEINTTIRETPTQLHTNMGRRCTYTNAI